MSAIRRIVPLLCAFAFTVNAQTARPTVAVQQDVSIWTQATSPPPTISVERKVSVFTQSTPPPPPTKVVRIVNEPTTSIATTIVRDEPTTSQIVVADVSSTTEANETPSTESIAVDAVQVTTPIVRPAISAAGATIAARVPRQVNFGRYSARGPQPQDGSSRRKRGVVGDVEGAIGKRQVKGDVEGAIGRARRFTSNQGIPQVEEENERSKRGGYGFPGGLGGGFPRHSRQAPAGPLAAEGRARLNKAQANIQGTQARAQAIGNDVANRARAGAAGAQRPLGGAGIGGRVQRGAYDNVFTSPAESRKRRAACDTFGNCNQGA